MNNKAYLILTYFSSTDGFLMKPSRSSDSARFSVDRRVIDPSRRGEIGDQRIFECDEIVEVHAIGVVPAMAVEEDLILAGEALIDDDRDVVKSTEGGRRAALTVVKDEFEVVLGREIKLVESEYFGQFEEVDPTRRGKDGEEVLIFRGEQNAFRDRFAGEVRRVRPSRRGRRRGAQNVLKSHTALDQIFGDGHHDVPHAEASYPHCTI
jgi:hypothetical protein